MEQVGLFEKRQLPFPELAKLRHGHISAQQILPALGESAFSHYFKFAIVRNPFDRFVSYCAFMSRDNGRFAAAPREFMKFIFNEVQPFEHILFRPQSEFVTDASGRLMMDFIGRTEQLQADYDRICDTIGIPRSALGRVNESAHRDYRDYYDDELIALVSEFYRSDLNLFDYAFDRNAIDTGHQSA